MILNIKNKLVSVEIEVSNTSNRRNWLHFEDVQLPKMEDGEYEYFLYNDNELIASGLCVIGDYKPVDNTQYEKNKNEIKQYNG